MDAAGIGIWSLAPKSSMLFLDDTSRALTGCQLTGWFGFTELMHFIDPQDYPLLREAIDAVLLSASAKRLEYTFRTRQLTDGQYRWLRMSGQPRSVDDNALHIVVSQIDMMSGQPRSVDDSPLLGGIMQDVTAETIRMRFKRSELGRQTTFLQNALTIAELGTFEVDLETATARYSDNVAGWFRLPANVALHADTFARIHPQDRTMVEQTIAQSLASKEQCRHDVIYRINGSGTGDFLYLRSIGQVLYQDDKPAKIIGIIQNVTAETLATQQVRQAQSALEDAIELAALSTWTLAINEGTVSYSQRFMDWLGFSEATRPLDEAYNPLPEPYRQTVAAALKATWQPGSNGRYDNEHPVINRLTGQIRIIRAQAQVIYDAAGKPLRLEGIAQDITEHRQLQQELERQVNERTVRLDNLIRELRESNRNLEQFAYVAGHDLQEPLRKIKSFGDLLKDRYAFQLGDGVTFIDRMQAAAIRMSGLISDLLTYSKVTSRKETATHVSLNQVLGAVLDNLELTLQETDAVLHADPLPQVWGDRFQFGQLFQNLISNALKFRRTDIRPEIRITCREVSAAGLTLPAAMPLPASGYYCIEVSDNGIGFDEKNADRIFQMFQRLHGKNQYAGTGIGLATCQRVVANHGGIIKATGMPGKGAVFTVFLPKEESAG
ncbi:hypothetical protein BLX24_03000 [Arsenicibacter rosenii]|uniref:histidine kinase n=2 Tax=Arsenicibacter rosenii TaxID=1750698 RepID=A0A1S2VQJ3_9BACT|nr:hypothetical protein BLX24_03000 [Arsenicibacter rosenii]